MWDVTNSTLIIIFFVLVSIPAQLKKEREQLLLENEKLDLQVSQIREKECVTLYLFAARGSLFVCLFVCLFVLLTAVRKIGN